MQVANYVRTLSKLEPEPGVDVAAGKKIFADNCAVCHGEDGKGNCDWARPTSPTACSFTARTLRTYPDDHRCAQQHDAGLGRALDPVTIKTLAVYRAQLGRGTVSRMLTTMRRRAPRGRRRGSPLCVRPESLPAEGERNLPPNQMGAADRLPGILLLAAFVRWDRGPNPPHQAVLVDIAHSRFYFFFIEIWPQEVYYFTGLLIIAALTLFLSNALSGRVWCGYFCPQTVWTDLFYGSSAGRGRPPRPHQARRSAVDARQDRASASPSTAIWLLIAWWTGGAWVLYFADAPTLVRESFTLQAPLVAYLWIGILTFTTYFLAGHMREQVCLYMCPWPRIQAALTDVDALNVTYSRDRGEPRMSVKEAAKARARGPARRRLHRLQSMRRGLPDRHRHSQRPQLGCIQCGLCIDACDKVMREIGRPTRLIAYDTDRTSSAASPGLEANFPRRSGRAP